MTLLPLFLVVTLTTAPVALTRGGKPMTVELRLDPALRYHDEDVWCGWNGGQPKVKGRLWAVVTLPNGQRVTTDLTALLHWSEETWFAEEPWQLALTDINHDGVPEFNVGRYGSCNGWLYRLLTFTKSGGVEAFPAPELYIPSNEASTAAIEPVPHGFRALEHPFPEDYACVTYRWSRESRAYVEASRKSGVCEPE